MSRCRYILQLLLKNENKNQNLYTVNSRVSCRCKFIERIVAVYIDKRNVHLAVYIPKWKLMKRIVASTLPHKRDVKEALRNKEFHKHLQTTILPRTQVHKTYT